jgi:hypothetical protein
VLSEIERVMQSNREFRLNDSVNVNVIHVEMPHGGKGTKRSEISLEKHLARKGSIIRIQNKDELCLARALVVAKAKIDNDSQYKSIVDHRRSMETQLAYELHEKRAFPSDPVAWTKSNNFRHISPTTKSTSFPKSIRIPSFIRGPSKRKEVTCISTITIMMLLRACPVF